MNVLYAHHIYVNCNTTNIKRTAFGFIININNYKLLGEYYKYYKYYNTCSQ